MAAIRPTIEFVCDLLGRFGIDGVAPETLRQAKFNNPDAAVALEMWRVLHGLVCLALAEYAPRCWARTGSPCVSALERAWRARESDAAAAAFVRLHLVHWGILRASAAAPGMPWGPDDDGAAVPVSAGVLPPPPPFLVLATAPCALSAVSSRELLLAAGWTMARAPAAGPFDAYLRLAAHDAEALACLPPFTPATAAAVRASAPLRLSPAREPGAVDLADALALDVRADAARIAAAAAAGTVEPRETQPSAVTLFVRTRARQTHAAVSRLAGAARRLATALLPGAMHGAAPGPSPFERRCLLPTKPAAAGAGPHPPAPAPSPLLQSLLAAAGAWQRAHAAAGSLGAHEALWWQWLGSVAALHAGDALAGAGARIAVEAAADALQGAGDGADAADAAGTAYAAVAAALAPPAASNTRDALRGASVASLAARSQALPATLLAASAPGPQSFAAGAATALAVGLAAATGAMPTAAAAEALARTAAESAVALGAAAAAAEDGAVVSQSELARLAAVAAHGTAVAAAEARAGADGEAPFRVFLGTDRHALP